MTNLPEYNQTRRVKASYYGVDPVKEHLSDRFADNTPFNPNIMAVASWEYPLGTRLIIKSPDTGKAVIAEVKDRGPNKRLLVDSKDKQGNIVPGRQLDMTVGLKNILGLANGQGLYDLDITPLLSQYNKALAEENIQKITKKNEVSNGRN